MTERSEAVGRLYFPVVKSKQGERWAMGRLSATTKAAISPIVQLWPGSSTDAIRGHVDEISRRWGGAGPLLMDASWVQPSAGTPHPLATAAAAAANRGQTLVPTVRNDSDQDYLTAAAAIAKSDGQGGAIRLQPAAWSAAVAQPLLAQLLKDLALAPKDVDLLLDAGPVGAQRAFDLYGVLLAQCLPTLPWLADWRRVAVLGGSFPVDLRGIQAGSIVRLPRFEWELWKSLPSVGRTIGYGDYGVGHPDAVEDVSSPKAIPIYAQLRYTLDDCFAVTKGGDIRRVGVAEVYAVAGRIAGLPEFPGATFSEGDEWIAERAGSAGTSGNYTKWREVATVHHITWVCRQLASSLGASARP